MRSLWPHDAFAIQLETEFCQQPPGGPGTPGPASGRTSGRSPTQGGSCQSGTGYGSAFTCLYAATGKKPGRAKRGFPVVTASHRSAMALRNAAESVRGKARVCGNAPAPGATGTADGDALALDVALALGDADFAEGDPVPAVLAFAAG